MHVLIILDQIKENLEKQNAELTSKLADDAAKLQYSQQSVNELRQELDQTKVEIQKLNKQVKEYDLETSEYRKERDSAVDERDTHLKMAERKSGEVERLQSDVTVLKQQLQLSINEKCEALAKVNEIQSKELNLEFKEKRLEQERHHLNATIKQLNENLNKTMAELSNVRRENTLRLLTTETKLTEKTEELKIANSAIEHLRETNNSLTKKAEDLAAKLMAHSDEVTKMMDNYKKELFTKTKLADLYKDDCEDNLAQINELKSGIIELKQFLKEATDSYGSLETKHKQIELQHEQEIDEKNQQIEDLKTEIKNANELLKSAQEENLEHAVESLAPTAAASSRLIKSGMTLTEVFSIYVKTAEELQIVKKDNNRLNSQIQNILMELEDKAPIFKKQTLDHQQIIETNNELRQQLDSMIGERVDHREELNNLITKVNYYERENKKLKITQSDLGRQVCYLLKEIEHVRGGFTSDYDQSIASDVSANEVITKRLVTFSDIQEMQENNEKLLLLVRDLSTKLEEMETTTQSNDTLASNTSKMEVKLENYIKRIKELQDNQEYQTQMTTTCIQQRDRYKKLYFESMKNGGGALNDEDMDVDNINSPRSKGESGAGTSQSFVANQQKDKRITELDEKMVEITKELKAVKEEYDNYRKEKQTNDKMLNEQFDKMRNELREVTSVNCKLMASSEYNAEQLKIQQKNIATYKKQIQTLEERNKNYESTIVKHEQTILHIRDETMNAHSRLARYEVLVENLKQENAIHKATEARLQMEKEIVNRDRQSQNMLMNNLEMIKASFERSETEGRQRMETRLDETSRECSALRRRLQEEQDHFRELSAHLERQSESIQKKMADEKLQADKLRAELLESRDEIAQKTKQIDELSKKLQESLTPNQMDNPITQANKRAKEIELKYDEAKAEIEALKQEIETGKEHIKQYCNLAQCAENELKELHNKQTEYKLDMEKQVELLQRTDADQRKKIIDLETEVSLQMTNIQLTADGTHPVTHNKELSEALVKVNELNREIRELRDQCKTLTVNVQNAEHKYANEMLMHSNDIQAMTSLKDELNKIKEEIDNLRLARDKAVEILEVSKSAWTETERLLRVEKEEVENRLVDLDSQNSVLHDQIQELSTKLSINSALNETGGGGGDHDMNESVPDSSLINRSIKEEDIDNRSSEQLLQIIKYLRKEKDISVAKVDIIRTENIRLECEFNMAKKKLEETINELQGERTKSETGILTTMKHNELLRKVETLNAITDSNRSLREERDLLLQKIKTVTERISAVEDELVPLQEKNRELTLKTDTMQVENTSLRVEATRWRQRANLLVERSNKTSPEDFKRLQSEREALAKMLTNEKEMNKKLTEELNSIRTEKTRLDAELHSIQDDNKRFTEEFAALKQLNVKITQEIAEIRNTLAAKDEDVKKAQEELGLKEGQLVDMKNKEIQIRKIAKRYKDLYFEIKDKPCASCGVKGVGEKSEDGAGGSVPTDEPGTSTSIPSTTDNNNKLIELNMTINRMENENEALKKELETVNASLTERDGQHQKLLKEAKAHILTIRESKQALTRELTTANTQIQSMNQTQAEKDAYINSMKSQLESRINRMEKEYSDLDKQYQEVIAKSKRDTELLNNRINVLQRKMGQPPVTTVKPSTSSNSTLSSSTTASGSGVPSVGSGSGSQSSDGKQQMDTTTSTSSSQALRTANVKPMSGTNVQQSATVQPWRGGGGNAGGSSSSTSSSIGGNSGETPLASIRPMSVVQQQTQPQTTNTVNSRTAAVLPTTSQTNINNQGSSASTSSSSTSSSSTTISTALVPPQQQLVHTTGNNNQITEVMSSSPTSSHTDYMPATSSATIVVATIPPMSSQEAESIQTTQNNDTNTNTLPTSGTGVSAGASSGSGSSGQQQSQQTVALVSPRVECQPQQNIVTPQIPQISEQNPAPSTSGGGGTSSSSTSSSSASTSSSSTVIIFKGYSYQFKV